ncbi:hypothetical protein EL84_03325 [Paenibacillus sp. VT-400]|uniref:hypothetical protein n=1 Tax=Paenibacillus sp. VT-400 TaxID=1495853 RepID=UPI00064AF6E3|nr:hypothetical protein [Paenibacillus sp. VT-400]KLU57557.1 hypothetical protein EL84_03325 [Paenibacillus sp. VT-400]
MGKYKHLLLMLLIVVPFTIINFSSYLKGHTPSIFQAAASILFILVWFVYGIMQSDKYKEYALLSTLYWLAGVILLTIGYFANSAIIFIPATIIWAGPVYGIRYFLELPANLVFALVSIVIVYVSSIVGVLLGKIFKKRSVTFGEK